MYININRANNVNYKIFYKGEMYDVLEEIDWSESNITNERDLTYSGINYNLSNNVVFVNSTADFLSRIYDNDGIDAIALLLIVDSNGEENNIGYIDFYTIKINVNKVSVKLSDRGYTNLLQTNLDKEINISNKSLDGVEIEEINTVDLVLKTRGVRKSTILKNTTTPDYLNLEDWDFGTVQDPKFTHRIPVRMNLNGDYWVRQNRNVNSRFVCPAGLGGNRESRGVIALNIDKDTSNDDSVYNQNSDGIISNHNKQLTGTVNSCNSYDSLMSKSVGGTFIHNEKNTELKASIKIDLSFTLDYTLTGTYPLSYKEVLFEIVLAKYSYNEDPNYLREVEPERITLIQSLNVFQGGVSKKINLSLKTSRNIYLNKGDYYSIEYRSLVKRYSYNGNNWHLHNALHTFSDSDSFTAKSLVNGIYANGVQTDKLTIDISRVHKQPPSSHKVFLLKDVIYRYFNLIGVRRITSKILNGTLKNLIITNGFMLRGFDLSLEENKNKNISISTKKLIDSIFNIYGLGFGIEILRGKEYLIIEKRGYFYTNEILDLSRETSNITSIEPIHSLYYNTIKTGYMKPTSSENENLGTLDEFNMDIEFGTEIKTKTNNLSLKSWIRADSLAIEDIRLKAFNDNKNEDTQYDNSIFLIDCKKSNSFYTPRIYSDFSNRTPTGVLDPINIYNIAISPKNILMNNINFISCGLMKGKLTVLNMSSAINFKYSVGLDVVTQDEDIDVTPLKRLFKAELTTITIDLNLIDFKRDYRKLIVFNDSLKGYLYSVNYKESSIQIMKK